MLNLIIGRVPRLRAGLLGDNLGQARHCLSCVTYSLKQQVLRLRPKRAALRRTERNGGVAWLQLVANYNWLFVSHSFTLRSRSAFVITDTLLKLMAAAAMIGLSSHPNLG